MEIIGQLTGSLAPDFNNPLTVFLSNLEMLHELWRALLYAGRPLREAVVARSGCPEQNTRPRSNNRRGAARATLGRKPLPV